MSAPQEKNPDPRPLPDGWVTEYSPQWNSWYYVNTKEANPQAIWHHPADNTGASAGAAPPSAATPSNPDTRPLPEGYISEYSPEHKTWYYVNTKAADPGSTVTWAHPADAKDGRSSATPAAPPTGAGEKHNPDTRPLPPGWITDYDENYKAWYYVNTKRPDDGASWQHPSETQGPGPSSAAPATSSIASPPYGQQHNPVPAAAAAAPAPSASSPGTTTQAPPYTGPPASENPDKRPLPTGWITKYDENYKVWYYVDTSKPGGPSSWEHPADKTGTAPTTAQGTTPSVGGSAPVHSSTPGVGGGHGSNPDTRPLPTGWITQYDANRNTWFYVNTTLHPPQTTWEHPAGKLASSPGVPPPATGANTGTTTGATPGKGLEGLLGAKGGKMVGGFLGSKAKTQMDGFADILGTEYSKFKKNHPPGGAPPGQAQYQAPPGQAPGQAVPPPANPPPPASSSGLGGSLGNLSGMAGKFGFGKK